MVLTQQMTDIHRLLLGVAEQLGCEISANGDSSGAGQATIGGGGNTSFLNNALHSGFTTVLDETSSAFESVGELDYLMRIYQLPCNPRPHIKSSVGFDPDALKDLQNAGWAEQRVHLAQRFLDGCAGSCTGEESLKLLDQAIALQPTVPSFYFLRGKINLKLSRANDALRDYDFARSLGGVQVSSSSNSVLTSGACSSGSNTIANSGHRGAISPLHSIRSEASADRVWETKTVSVHSSDDSVIGGAVRQLGDTSEQPQRIEVPVIHTGTDNVKAKVNRIFDMLERPRSSVETDQHRSFSRRHRHHHRHRSRSRSSERHRHREHRSHKKHKKEKSTE